MRSRSSETEDGAAGAPPREQTSTLGADSCSDDTTKACSVSDVTPLGGWVVLGVTPLGESRCTTAMVQTHGCMAQSQSLHLRGIRAYAVIFIYILFIKE